MKKYTFADVIAKDSKCDWKDISKEEYRTYKFARKKGFATIHLVNPVAIDIRKSGGHIVVCEDGTALYIAKGWICIEWKNKPDVSRAQW